MSPRFATRLVTACCVVGWMVHDGAKAADGMTIGLTPPDVGDGWVVGSPYNAGFDPAALDDIAARIDNGDYGDIHVVLVEKDGVLVLELYRSGAAVSLTGDDSLVSYDRDTVHPLFSVSKSITSLVAGIAADGQAETLLESPVLDHLPAWIAPLDPDAGTITVGQALDMTAGFSWNELGLPRDDPRNPLQRLSRASDPLYELFRQPMAAAPGETFTYNSGLTLALSAVIAQVTDQSFDSFAEQSLFSPLNVTEGGAAPYGPWLGVGVSTTAWDMEMTGRDLAKFGSLVLHSGRWNGQQIVPADWIERISHAQSFDVEAGPYVGYGYHWWHGSVWTDSGPERAVAARGLGGQRLVVLPDIGLSVTVLAWNSGPGGDALSDRLIRDLLEARR